ncbi:serine hydrolase domain-containing protein [Raoultella sp. T31]|uniref:serine hydrolase domain-containing protein n=1 Tax=Raoultella sp. T31 TaxID=2054594 RepID=UPI000C283C18|nr:serine hydrolase [Raoultella sp. T31]
MLPGNKTILTRIIASVTIFVVIVLSGIYLQAGFSSPSRNITGDAQLVRFMTPFLRGARGHVAVALIKPGGVQYGLWGGDFSQEFEVGSLSKTMTAALLADAENRGEVKPETTVGELLPGLPVAMASVRLSELASHHSGLPDISTTPWQSALMLLAIATHKNPWRFSENDIIAMLRRTEKEENNYFRYSSMGYAVLGLTLEKMTHMSYSELLNKRLLAPTGMKNTFVATPDDGAKNDVSRGWSAAGYREAPWYMLSFAPAGGVRSTITDMVKYTQALLRGKLPGSVAMDPKRSTDERDTRIGYGWFTTKFRGREITWHNGETAGYASVIAIDRASKTGVVILSDTAWPVITPAIRLLISQPVDN